MFSNDLRETALDDLRERMGQLEHAANEQSRALESVAVALIEVRRALEELTNQPATPPLGSASPEPLERRGWFARLFGMGGG